MSLGNSIIIFMILFQLKSKLNNAQKIICSRTINYAPHYLRTPVCTSIWNGVKRVNPSVPYLNCNRITKGIHDLAGSKYFRKRNYLNSVGVRTKLTSQIFNYLTLKNQHRADNSGTAKLFFNRYTNIPFGNYVRNPDDYLNNFRIVPTTVSEDSQQQTKYLSEIKPLSFDKIPLPTNYAPVSSSFEYHTVVEDITTKVMPINLHDSNSEEPSISRKIAVNTRTFKMGLNEPISSISMPTYNTSEEILKPEKDTEEELLNIYIKSLDIFERELYTVTFNKLINISPDHRKENGISFVQSGLFLSLFLMALSTETDNDVALEIEKYFRLNIKNAEKAKLIRDVLSALPKAKNGLRWRWSSRLILGQTQSVSQEFCQGAAKSLHLTIDRFNGTEQPEEIAKILNRKVEEDSGGIIRDAFEPDEVSDGIRAVAVTTVNFRARWRSAATVLNGTKLFRDVIGTPVRNIRMIRINDNMRYANFQEWSFEAIEIPYSTKGLSLLMLVPYGPSLRTLASKMISISIFDIINKMDNIRIAVSMPIYTLRMTLLLPSKLQTLGIQELVSWNGTDSGRLRLSHAVQRVMFWAEAGRNAFKDDGIEWDETPTMNLTIDRPYLFFVRWKNMTLMNGNFVL
ncbi:hypothetical protein ACJJTC_008101 [Scirpophaga incertulas]